MTCADRIRAYRARQKEAGRVDSSRARAREHKRFARRAKIMAAQKPFTGCDGEGCGVDNVGRQLYMLFRMGKRELFTGRPLSTCELLDFICDHSCNDILVGFSFGYDVTMILRDLSENQQRRLFGIRILTLTTYLAIIFASLAFAFGGGLTVRKLARELKARREPSMKRSDFTRKVFYVRLKNSKLALNPNVSELLETRWRDLLSKV